MIRIQYLTENSFNATDLDFDTGCYQGAPFIMRDQNYNIIAIEKHPSLIQILGCPRLYINPERYDELLEIMNTQQCPPKYFTN